MDAAQEDTAVQRLAGAIREARVSAGLTQTEVAELVGLDREYVSRLERGIATQYFERLEAVLDAVGLALVAIPKSLLVTEVDGSDA